MKPKPWKILSQKIIHKTPWIEIVADDCEVNGQPAAYTYTRRVAEGPLIIPEDNDGKLWLVQQYRHPIKKVIWQFPVEGMFPDESWEAAAARGVMEEVNLQAAKLTDLGVVYPDPGGLEQTTHVFLAQELSSAPKHLVKHAETEEEVEELVAQSFSVSEIDELIDEGEICDNWTFGALFLYNRHKQSQA